MVLSKPHRVGIASRTIIFSSMVLKEDKVIVIHM